MCQPQPSPPPIDFSGRLAGRGCLPPLRFDEAMTIVRALLNVWRARRECGK